MGADAIKSGNIVLEGKNVVGKSPYEAMKNGIVLVPEDRKMQGIFPNMSVGANISIGILKRIIIKWDLLIPKEKPKL